MPDSGANVGSSSGGAKLEHADFYVAAAGLMWLTGPVLALILLPSRTARKHVRFAIGATIAASLLVTFVVSHQMQSDYVFGAVFLFAPVGLLLNGAFLLFVRRPKGTSGAMTTARRGMAYAAAAFILGTAVWSVENVGMVAWRAQALAGDRAFCLEVGQEYGYQPVRRWGRLLGIAMLQPFYPGGSDDFQWSFHAVLVISASEQYNWSYWAQDFLPIRSTSVPHPSACTPVANFIGTLTLV